VLNITVVSVTVLSVTVLRVAVLSVTVLLTLRCVAVASGLCRVTVLRDGVQIVTQVYSYWSNRAGIRFGFAFASSARIKQIQASDGRLDFTQPLASATLEGSTAEEGKEVPQHGDVSELAAVPLCLWRSSPPWTLPPGNAKGVSTFAVSATADSATAVSASAVTAMVPGAPTVLWCTAGHPHVPVHPRGV